MGFAGRAPARMKLRYLRTRNEYHDAFTDILWGRWDTFYLDKPCLRINFVVRSCTQPFSQGERWKWIWSRRSSGRRREVGILSRRSNLSSAILQPDKCQIKLERNAFTPTPLNPWQCDDAHTAATDKASSSIPSLLIWTELRPGKSRNALILILSRISPQKSQSGMLSNGERARVPINEK